MSQDDSYVNIYLSDPFGNYNLVITDSNSCQIQITETINIGNIILLDTFKYQLTLIFPN